MSAVAVEVLIQRPTSTISEASLLHGYSRVANSDVELLERHCACGGWIHSPGSDKATRYAVEVHNSSPGHVAWAIEAGLREREEGSRW